MDERQFNALQALIQSQSTTIQRLAAALEQVHTQVDRDEDADKGTLTDAVMSGQEALAMHAHNLEVITSYLGSSE